MPEPAKSAFPSGTIATIGTNLTPVRVLSTNQETGKVTTEHTAPQGTVIRTTVYPTTLRIISALFVALTLLFAAGRPAAAQINGSPMPFVKPQFFTNNGQPAASYKLCTYSAGTNNPIRTYTTSALSVPNTNPLVLDSAGRASIFWPNVAIKVVLLTEKSTTNDCLTGTMVTVWSQDNVETDSALVLSLLSATTGASHVGYNLNVSGSQNTTVSHVLDTYYEAVADFGADPTGTTDSTTALQAGIAAQITNGRSCLHLQAGTYKVSNTSGVGSIILSSTATNNGCIRGDGPGQTNILQSTNGGVTIAVQGSNTVIRDLFIAKEPAVTGGTGISLYPDVTANGTWSAVTKTKITNVLIDSAYCNDPSEDNIGNTCVAAANANRLTYGIIIQSGHYDSVYNSITNTRVSRAGDCFYQISGGLAGSAENGAVNATQYVGDTGFVCTDAALRLDSSGENTVSSFTADYSGTEIKLGSQTTGTYAKAASSGNKLESLGEGSSVIFDAGSTSFGNIYITPRSGLLTMGAGAFTGSKLYQNTILSFDNLIYGMYSSVDGFLNVGLTDIARALPTATLQVNETANVPEISRITANTLSEHADADYLHINPYGASLAGGTYTSGITAVGSTGQTCKITVTSGTANAVVFVGLTGTNTIAGGTPLFLTGGGSGIFTSAPTTGAASAQTATSCSGTATISTTLTLPGFVERTAATFPTTQPVHHFVMGQGSSGTPSVCTENDLATSAVTAYGAVALGQECFQAIDTASTAASQFAPKVVNASSALVIPHGWGGDGIDRNNLSVAFSALPACNSTTVMWTANVNNSNTVTYGATAAGGGSANVPVRCDLALDGTTYNWRIH